MSAIGRVTLITIKFEKQENSFERKLFTTEKIALRRALKSTRTLQEVFRRRKRIEGIAATIFEHQQLVSRVSTFLGNRLAPTLALRLEREKGDKTRVRGREHKCEGHSRKEEAIA